MPLQNVTQEGRVHARTMNSTFEGMVVMSGATRLREFINRPCPTVTLTDVSLTTGPVGVARPAADAGAVTLYKSQILYMTLVEEIQRARARVYERDVLAAHLKKQRFTFQLDGGIIVDGEVVGGEHSVAFPKGSFLALSNPIVRNLRGTDLLGALSFVLINLARVEYYRSRSSDTDGSVKASSCQEPIEEPVEEPRPKRSEPEMDFSDFEEQFVRIDRVDITPSP